MAKTKLNQKIIDDASKYTKAGNYAMVVCQYIGVAPKTYYDWLNRAITDESEGKSNSIYCNFRNAIKEAEAESEIRNVQVIQKAAQNGTWQAAAWFLERKYRDRYGVKITSEITGKDGGPIEIDSPRERINGRIAGIASRIAEDEDTK